MKYHRIPALLVLGALLGHAGQVHAQRPRPQPKSPEERYEDMKKTPFLAATLEWIIPTVGHDYAGEREAGMPPTYLAAAGVVVFYTAAWSSFYSCPPELNEPRDPNCGRVFGLIALGGALTFLGSRVWASVSAWKLANRTNAFYRRRLGLDDAGLALSVTPMGQFGLGVSLRF